MYSLAYMAKYKLPQNTKIKSLIKETLLLEKKGLTFIYYQTLLHFTT